MSGDYQLEDTVYLPFTTRAFATGIPTALVSGAVEIYEDAGTTQITTAETLTVSLDTIAGFNMIAVVATAANGFGAGQSYTAILSAGTVDSVSVIGEVVGHFTLDMSGAAKDLANATDGLGALKTLIDANQTDANTIITNTTNIETDTQDIQGRLPAALVGGLMSSDVTAISTDTTAANNLELQYDTTGLTGDTFPATQASIGGIGSGSSGAVNIKATEDNSSAAIIDSITKVGTITGDFNNVHADTGGTTIISIAHVGNDIDFVLGYDVGGARAGTSVSIVANVNGNADQMTIEAYDHVGAGWDIIGILDGTGGASYVTTDYPLYAEHTGTGGELGKVYIRFDNNATTPALLEIDRCSVAAVSTSTSVGYAMGMYWIDTVNGTSGTEIGTNGTADNPCTWANAVTMNATQPLGRFHIANNSSITLSANSDNCYFFGQAYTMALGGQSIDGAFFYGATVSGTGTNTSTHPIFEDCPIGAVSLPPSIMRRCFLSDTITNTGVGDWYINHCMSRVAGTGSPVFDFGTAVGNTGLNMRLYSGGIQLESMGDTGTDTASIEGFGNIIEGTCTGGTVAVRGNFTTASITNLTLSDNARIDTLQINAECDTAISDAALATAALLATHDGKLDTVDNFLDTEIAELTTQGDTNETKLDTLTTNVAALNDLAAADVLTQVNAALDTAISELGVAAPTATPSLRTGLMLMYMTLRNKLDITSTAKEVHNNAGTPIASKTLSDNGTTYSEAEMS